MRTWIHASRPRFCKLGLPEWYETAGETEDELREIEAWLLHSYMTVERIREAV